MSIEIWLALACLVMGALPVWGCVRASVRFPNDG